MTSKSSGSKFILACIERDLQHSCVQNIAQDPTRILVIHGAMSTCITEDKDPCKISSFAFICTHPSQTSALTLESAVVLKPGFDKDCACGSHWCHTAWGLRALQLTVINYGLFPFMLSLTIALAVPPTILHLG